MYNKGRIKFWISKFSIHMLFLTGWHLLHFLSHYWSILLNRTKNEFKSCQPMSRKTLITIIVCHKVGFVYYYDVLLHFLSLVHTEHWQGVGVFCAAVCTLGYSTFWFSSWANVSVSVCICVCVLAWLSMLVFSSSVPLMVHSEVVQWWTVKYSAVFLSPTHSGTQGQENNRWTKGI